LVFYIRNFGHSHPWPLFQSSFIKLSKTQMLYFFVVLHLCLGKCLAHDSQGEWSMWVTCVYTPWCSTKHFTKSHYKTILHLCHLALSDISTGLSFQGVSFFLAKKIFLYKYGFLPPDDGRLSMAQRTNIFFFAVRTLIIYLLSLKF
jgi:hypothetical protein